MLFSYESADMEKNLSPEAPQIIHVTDPTAPGQTLAIQGNAFQARSTCVKVGWLIDGTIGRPSLQRLFPEECHLEGQLEAEILTQREYALAAVLPESLKQGIFLVSVMTGNGVSDPVTVNRPLLQWVEGRTAEAGKQLRLFGRNLSGPCMSAFIAPLDGGEGQFIPVTAATDYAASVELPSTLRHTSYMVWLHNGYGGNFGWSNSLAVTVQPDARTTWPTTVFSVADYGADPSGAADCTLALQKALDAAGANGGGVVYFPKGVYRLDGSLEIKPKTLLLGEAMEDVVLKDDTDSPYRDMLLYGDYEFAIERMTIQSCRSRVTIASPKYMGDSSVSVVWWIPLKARNPKNPHPFAGFETWEREMHHLQQYTFQGVSRDVYIKEAVIRNHLPETMIPEGHFRAFAVGIAGDNINIEDSVISNRDNGGHTTYLFNCRYVRVMNNTYVNESNSGWTLTDGCENVVFENNTLDGRGEHANGGANSGFFFCHGNLQTRNLYIAGNHVEDIVGDGSGEAICFDAGLGVTSNMYMGYAGPCANNTLTVDTERLYKNIESATDFNDVEAVAGMNPEYCTGSYAVIIFGRGKGQYRRIAGNSADTLLLEEPWTVIPDSSSVFTVAKLCLDAIIANNTVERCNNGIVTFSGCENFIVADNTVKLPPARASSFSEFYGISDFGLRWPEGRTVTARPQMYNMYLNNSVSYKGIYVLGNTAELKDPEGRVLLQGTLQTGLVYRGNTVIGGSGFTVMQRPHDRFTQTAPIIEGVIFEQNRIEQAEPAITIDSYSRIDATVIRENILRGPEFVKNGGTGTVVYSNRDLEGHRLKDQS